MLVKVEREMLFLVMRIHFLHENDLIQHLLMRVMEESLQSHPIVFQILQRIQILLEIVLMENREDNLQDHRDPLIVKIGIL